MATAAIEYAPTEIYQQVDGYDWDHDEEFQGGLRAILGSTASPERASHLTMRAKCFYFSRKSGTKVDFDGYQSWRARQDASLLNGDSITEQHATPADLIAQPVGENAAHTTSAFGNAPAPASFAEICEMIESGKPIPGIKDIPDTVHEGLGTTSSTNQRKKPWETAATSVTSHESSTLEVQANE